MESQNMKLVLDTVTKMKTVPDYDEYAVTFKNGVTVTIIRKCLDIYLNSIDESVDFYVKTMTAIDY